jgi:hypothetical protein
MNRFGLAALALIFGFNASHAAGGTMANWHDEMIARFKQKIDFDAALRAEPAGQMVLLKWPDMLQAPGIAGGGWVVFTDTVLGAPGGSQRKWVLRKGDETLGIVGFISSSGVDAARQFLISQVSGTMMRDIPYERGPQGLGALSIIAPHPTQGGLAWVFRNACVSIDTNDTQVEMLPIAKWLQGLLQANLVPAGAPLSQMLPALSISSIRAAVGESVDISVQSESSVPKSTYVLKLKFDVRAIDESRFPGPREQLKGLVPGHTAVDVTLIDSKTLVSSVTHIDLEFFAAPAGR